VVAGTATRCDNDHVAINLRSTIKFLDPVEGPAGDSGRAGRSSARAATVLRPGLLVAVLVVAALGEGQLRFPTAAARDGTEAMGIVAPLVPPSGLPIRVAAVGDLACLPGQTSPTSCRTEDVAPLAEGADLVLLLGDVAQGYGTMAEYELGLDPAWGHLLDRTVPVPGNHDYLTLGAANYYAYFGARAGDPRRGYYTVDLPGWRIYALNSNCDAIGGCAAGSAQWRWLRAALRTNPGCSLAMMHHPRRASVIWGDPPYAAPAAGLYDLLIDADVPLVLAGHTHIYERIVLGERTQQIITGTGGYGLHRVAATGRRTRGSVAGYDDTFGLLDLRLEDGAYSSAFVTLEGERRDEHRRHC
jgi:acid phosphatase type 7